MTAPDNVPPTAALSSRTTGWGGVGLAVAGALQLWAGFQYLGPDTPEPATLLLQIVEGVVLLTASTLLSFGRHGKVGIVGTFRLGRVALIASGSDGLLTVVLTTLATTGGADQHTSITIAFITQRLMGVTTVAAVVILRAQVLAGIARWALLLVTACDAASGARSSPRQQRRPSSCPRTSPAPHSRPSLDRPTHSKHTAFIPTPGELNNPNHASTRARHSEPGA